MHYLRTISEQVEGLYQFIDRALEYKLVQGVVLDINPIWFAAYRIRQAGIELRFNDIYEDSLATSFLETLMTPGPTFDQYVDLEWNSEAVEYWHYRIFDRSFGHNSPFIVKAVMFPISGPLDAETRYALVRLAQQSPFPTIVETRSPAELVVSPGDRCDPQSGRHGTIGGFLTDKLTGSVYAATCGHVVTAGRVFVNGYPIGQCTHARGPVTLAVGDFCNRACANMTRLDLALIDIRKSIFTNTVSSIAAAITPTEAITVTGGVTGTSSYEVGGACMVYKIGGACWENLFEIRSPSGTGIVSPRVTALLATVPKPGDSGAWVKRAIAPDWCGVLVASDHSTAYALEAETVITEANSEFSMDLVLA